MAVYYSEYTFGLNGLEIPMTLAEENGSIVGVLFGIGKGVNEWEKRETSLIAEARSQLDEYFLGKRRAFELPLSPTGTEFQLAVWDALLAIPFGETRSYSDIARAIGKPNACRAVGMANNRNPVAVIIPCHRVIGSDGSLVGYGGGLPLKKALLDMESRLKDK